MKVNKLIQCLILASLAGASFAANIVQDPGFEASAADCFGSAACTPLHPAWTFVDAASGSLYGAVLGTPHSGVMAAGFAGTTAGSYDAIQQTLTTSAGQTYTLSFWLNTGFDHSDAGFQVFWDGALVYDLPAGTDAAHQFAYKQISLAVQATGNSTVLRFAGYNLPSADYFDDVSVDSAVPEPASWMLAGAGVLALGLRKLRHR